MTKIIDYSNTVIYKICCKDEKIEDVYVGHTTNFINRKARHKSNCNNINGKEYNLKIYTIIRDNGGFENWSMIEIEKFQDCNDINEAIAKERYYYEVLNAKLNSNCPGRNVKEYKKEYYQDNKDNIQKNSKNYYENNKDKINTHYICDVCNGRYTHNNRIKHLNTEKHQTELNNLLFLINFY
jgi:hypothetical protein